MTNRRDGREDGAIRAKIMLRGCEGAINRNQSWQMQKVHRKRKFNAKEASRIQQLFRIHPRRAVRLILDEAAPRFDGCVKPAEEFLRATYEEPAPSDDLVAITRSTCGLSPVEQPSD